jgi:hypothetical protein
LLIIIGILLLITSYFTYSFSLAYCVHHIDTPNTKSIYSYFLKLLNEKYEDEDNFSKLIFSWSIFMISAGLTGIGIVCIWIGIVKII